MKPRPRWWIQADDAAGYDQHFERLSSAGVYVHGEADLVAALGPRTVLDAGCGTGRVARELARRGIEVVGVDVDHDMIVVARERAPELEWHEADLATLELGRTFDLAVLAGNVMLFLERGAEAPAIASIARHLAPGGLLLAGFETNRQLSLAEYDRYAAQAGLELRERWATWERDAWSPNATYAVSLHARLPRPARSPHP